MQGFNMGRYVPPDLEGLTTGNAIHRKKPPGFHGSTQTIRFEMPFSIFCATCSGHIAQGTRFNAQKSKVGSYFSSPIFAFRMKHTTCQGWIEIRTDPKNTAYVVAEGGKRKEAEVLMEEEARAAGTALGVIKVHEVSGKGIEEDPFAKREKEVEGKVEIKRGAERIEELQRLSERQWNDPYEHNRKIRRVFREERKELERKAVKDRAICERAGLAIKLLDETPEDAERAKLVEFGPSLDDESKIRKAESRPLFQRPAKEETLRITPRTRKREVPGLVKGALQSDLRSNTRAAMDPFLTPKDWSRPKRKLKEDEGSEEKRDDYLEEETSTPESRNQHEKVEEPNSPKPLLDLDYDSDS